MLKAWAFSIAGVLGIVFSLGQGQSALPDKEGRWEQAKRYLAEGRAKEAKAVFEGLVKEYPKEPDLRLFLALSQLRLKDVQEAKIELMSLLRVAPGHVEARTLLGWIYLEVEGNNALAIEEYSRVVELRPDLPEAYNNLGVALRKNGDWERAIQSFDRALKLRLDYSEARSNRGWVHAQQGRWGEARRDFEEALKINPKDAGALYGLSRALREARDYAGAQEALRRLIGQSPNFVYWLEWGQLQLVRYYWVLLLVVITIFLHGRYQKMRRRTNGG